MKTFHEEIPDLCQDALTDQLFDEHSIFFDIETTGFSPANSTLYMIGCARRKSNRICIDQFFAEKPEEEAEILAAFFQMLSPYTTIITFNGVGFDKQTIIRFRNIFGILNTWIYLNRFLRSNFY